MSKTITIKSRRSYTFKNSDNDRLWVLKVARRYIDNDLYTAIYFPATGYKAVVPYDWVRSKTVKDRRKKTLYGIGYLGDQFESIREQDKELARELLDRWKLMIYRCYNPKYKSHNIYSDIGVTVCERWHSFSNFYYDVQRLPGFDRNLVLAKMKLSLDKDCKQQALEENKIYSPITCVWLSYKEQQRYVDHYKPQKKVKIYVTRPDGSVTLEEGLGRISRKYNVDMKCMNRCLKGIQKETKGYKFSYYIEDRLK